jgi:hypothetical protein
MMRRRWISVVLALVVSLSHRWAPRWMLRKGDFARQRL